MCCFVDVQKQKEDLQRIKELRLMDDILMVKCFEDSPERAELLLRLILKKPVLQVQTVQIQWFGPSAGLDIFAEDADGHTYNIKVFCDETPNFKYCIDFDEKMSIHLYSCFQDRPEHYIIHIIEHGSNCKAVSHSGIMLDGMCDGDWYGDIINILYVNGERKNRSPLGQLMFDFSYSDPSDMNYALLADRVRYLKESPEGVQAMCEMLEKKQKAQ